MARQRGDPTLAALARRRADLSSTHFGLAFQMAQAGEASAGRLAVSVPKRQLKRAVDRNALKRVAREAWRLASWGAAPRPQTVLLRLRRAEPDWRASGRSALKKAWRVEIDELFLRLKRRASSRALPGPQPADAPSSRPDAVNPPLQEALPSAPEARDA